MLKVLLLGAALLNGGDEPERFDYWKPGVGVDASIAELSAAIAGDAQDKSARIRDLLNKAEEASRSGNQRQASAYLAEAWALRAEVLFDQGNRADAEQAFMEARRHGWTGAPPWQGRATPSPTQPRPDQPTITPPPSRQDRPTPPPPPTRPKRPRNLGGLPDPWPFHEHRPLRTSRSMGWHSLLGVPALEEAMGLPAETWDALAWMEIQRTDFSDDSGGGTSQFHTDLHEEAVQFDYGVTDNLVIGMRLTIGELLELDDDVIRVFQNGVQIVPTDDRGFAFSEIVFRGKYLADVGFGSVGILHEIKIGLSDSADLLTTGTIDLAFIGLFSKRLSEKFAIHINAGPVLPVGDAEIFEPEEDPSTFFAYGVAVTWKVGESWTVIGQIEGNTSAWGDVSAIDENVNRFAVGVRWRIGDTIILQGGLGSGFSELSGDLLLNGSIDLAF